MAKPVLGRSTADTETSPDEGLSIENSDIIQVALLEGSSLLATASTPHVLLVEEEATVDDQVGADEDRAVTFPWAGRGAGGIGLRPGHHLQVEDVDIVEEVCTVPAAEDDHLRAVDQVGGVIEAGSGSTAAFRALEPSHGEGVKRVQISEDSLVALASKDDDSGASQHGRVAVPGRRRRSRDARLDPPRRVHIEYMCIIQVGEAILFTFVEVAAKDDQRGAGEGR